MIILKGTLKCFIQMSLFCDKDRKRKKEFVQFQSYKNKHLNYKICFECATIYVPYVSRR